MSSTKVREYQAGDSKKIYSLFSKHTSYERDAKFWVWINRMLSDKKSIIIVGEHQNDIVGHYAIIPQKIKVYGKSYTVGFAIHAFIDPNFRNSFLIMQITKKMYKVAQAYGIDFIYGFPNENFREIQIKADKWKSVSLFNALEKEMLLPINTGLSLIPADDNYQDIYVLSEILDNKHQSKNIYLEKSLNYYLDRYFRHPQKLYQNFFVTLNDVNVAFVCLKTYDNAENKIGHLIDYIATKEVSLENIMQVVENYFYDKVSKLSLWKFSEKDKMLLLNNGFHETGFQTFLGIKMLIEDEELETKLIDFDNWSLCMGDSDAF